MIVSIMSAYIFGRRARYLRRVLYKIQRGRWPNGNLRGFIKEAIKRSERL